MKYLKRGGIAAFFCLLALILVQAQAVQAAEKPNIIVILTDDQGWGDLSISGNTSLATPHIDSIGKDGLILDRFFVCPVCSPTRAEFLTGRYHVRGGVYSTSAGGERLDLDETTIADVFKAAGYATGAFGKWHNGLQWPYHPNARGFDEYYGFCSGHWGHYFSPLLDHNQKIVKGNGFVVDDFTDHTLNFIDKNKNKPFFIYLPYNTPHSPMQVPDQFWEKFKNENMKDQDGKVMSAHYRAALAMCENIDWNVGRILKKLDELKIADNTLVMYFSDNGPNGKRWNGGMKGKKGSTDEGGVRVPCLIKWPAAIKAGRKVDRITSVIDILPTLADIAGIKLKTNQPIDGISLKPLLEGNYRNWSDRIIINYWKNKLSVRTQQYRLDLKGKLYDMIKDPNQTKPIKDPFIQKRLLKEAEQWRQNVLIELKTGTENRPHPVGHPDTDVTWLPARDGESHGGVKRSNKFPNDSHFVNWKTTEGKVTWNIEILTAGTYEAELWYTCQKANVGCEMQLSMGNGKTSAVIRKAFDPPLVGQDHDRSPRGESYVKDFTPTSLGEIKLTKGAGVLTLSALKIPGDEAVDVRFIKLTRK